MSAPPATASQQPLKPPHTVTHRFYRPVVPLLVEKCLFLHPEHRQPQLPGMTTNRRTMARNYDNDRYYDDERPRRGQRDSDWADDFETRDDGRFTTQRPRRDAYDTPGRRPDHHRNYDPPMNKPQNFRQRHPVLMNLLYIIITAALLLWVLMWFLDFWTFHGQERVVPDVKGQNYETAAANVDVSGLRPEISDSVFDSYARPGTVVEQTPVPGARIKKGGTVYLTIVAFSPKLITVPDFYNVSARQARSMFEGLGIKEVRQIPVVSEYAGLVLGAKFNGVALQPGARIPVSAVVTIEVGTGIEETGYPEEDADSLAIEIDQAIEELNIE